MAGAVETRIGLSEFSTLESRIDSRIGTSGPKTVYSNGKFGLNPRSFVFTEARLKPLVIKGLIEPLKDSFPNDPEYAKAMLIKGPEETVMRLVIFPRKIKEPITVWRASMKEGKEPSVSLASGGSVPKTVEPTEDLLNSLGEIVDASEPTERDLNYYISRLMAEIGPKTIKYEMGGRIIEIDDEGMRWSARDVAEVVKAARIAWESHKGQDRKSGEPYFDHPFEGAMNLFRLGLATPLRIKMALVHDVAEDDKKYKQPEIDSTTRKAPEGYKHWFRRITHQFAREIGFQAAKGSVLLAKPVPDGDYLLTPEDAEREYIRNITSSIDTLIVKLFADRWHNVKTLWAMPLDNIRKTIKETREKYLPLLDRITRQYPTQVSWLREDMEREMQWLE